MSNEDRRNKIIKQAKEILKSWTNNNSEKKFTKKQKQIGAAIVAATAGVSGLAYGITTLVKKGEPKVGVVNYVYTNMYKDAENNKLDALEEGRIIKYNKNDIVEWEQVDEYGKFEKTLSFIKVRSVLNQSTKSSVEQATENATNQFSEGYYNINNIKDYKSVKDIYTLAQSVDEYVKCNNIDSLNFRSLPDINSEHSRNIGKDKLYVCLNSEGIGEHNFKKAILIDEKGNIQQGYVADELDYISEDIEEKECIGVINSRTYIRDSAKLVEYDGARIEGKISNGEVVEIVDSSDESFYKCRLADSDRNDTFFLSKNTVSTDIDFDFDAKFIDDGLTSEPTYMKVFSNSGELINYTKFENPIAISSDDVLKVDGDKSRDGVYSVWNVTKGVVGYVDGVQLIDTESNKTIEAIYNPYKSGEETKPETTKSKPVDQQNRITGAYYDENKMSIVVDTMQFTKPELEKLIKHFKDSNIPVSGIIFSIGSTGGYDNSGPLYINHLKDDDGVYDEYILDRGTVSIQQIWDQIDAKMESIGRPNILGEANLRGYMGNLIENIEFALNNGIPVGLYYYSAEMDEAEVSAVAAYCYGFEKYLNTKSSIYRNSKLKLPFGIDIEDNEYGARENTSNTRRAELAQRLVELLGNGIEQSEASKYFCIDGHNPEDGYGILNNKVMFYGEIRNNSKNIQDLTSYKYDEMKSNLEQNGYSVYLWGTSQLDNVGFNFEPIESDNITGILSDKEEYLKSLGNVSNLNTNLMQKIAMNQAMLGCPYEGNSYDLSITTQENINKMLNGEKIDVSFEQAVQNSMDVGERSNSRNGARNQDYDDFEY